VNHASIVEAMLHSLYIVAVNNSTSCILMKASESGRNVIGFYLSFGCVM